jgi:hypothetical protein
MASDRIRQILNAQPFQRFNLHLADGRLIPVLHRDFVILSPSGRTMVVVQPDDSMNIIDLLLVTDLEIRPNGRTHRRKRH